MNVSSTSETRKDLVKALVTIDCIAVLASNMERYLDYVEKERFRRLITDLQINYAERME